MLARLASPDELDLAGELLRAHAYWRRCGLVADLVLLNDAGPPDELQHALEELIRLGPTADCADKPGGVFLKSAVGMPADDVMLLEAAARAILRGDDGVSGRAARARARPATLPADVARLTRHGGGRRRQAGCCRGSAVVRQRVGWIHAGWPGVRPDSARSRAAAGPVEQRPRQPWLRLPDHRVRRRLHVGGQRPVEPPDPVEQRPGRRPARRSPLSPRRGDRRVLVTDAGPLRRRGDDRRPSRPGLYALQPDQPRAGAGPPRPRLPC